jgi:hypothetical protein
VVPGAAQDAVRADRKVAQIFRDAHETYSTFRRIDLPDVDRGHGVRLHRLWPMFRMASTKPGRPPSITACSPTHREQRLLPATCAIMTQPSGAASQARSECDDAARRGGNTPEEKPTNYSFRLGVKYRRRSGNFDSSCYCNHVIAEDAGNEVRFGCGVDCEGGGINLALSKDSKSAIIRLERIVIWNRNKPDDDAADALLAGADDKIFRVDRAELRECAELVTDRQELAALCHK